MNRLVVTADDFGLATEVNEAVERAHRDGILTAASLMVAAPAVADAVARAKKMPSLKVGLHLVLVEAKPALPAERVPDLVGPDGYFRIDMARLGFDIAFRPRVRAQLRSEIAAQFEAFAATGLALDHVNAHKHFHLHPMIAAEALAAGRRYGLHAIRVPQEPAAIVDAVEPASSNLGTRLTGQWARVLRHQGRGLVMPDAVFGLAWTGAFDGKRLARLLARLPEGLIEIYSHPATADAFAGSAPGYRYRDELAALVDPAVIAAAASSRHRRCGYADA
ncbi:hopanoid biosynthesis-associated protein HpnK [Xanthobacteraceae bacterium Astr-EGSB]|uniref:hopanoid biosynthesis-associated protein HpnK n=1 Tax=Astrobacterium formosum TaxID=3069710 RepID=UPI0027B60947|nr:hopanoid biosynthesis-associated protein HpnK [Xanthobacteraceae bacterium Astr-EGSB]